MRGEMPQDEQQGGTHQAQGKYEVLKRYVLHIW